MFTKTFHSTHVTDLFVPKNFKILTLTIVFEASTAGVSTTDFKRRSSILDDYGFSIDNSILTELSSLDCGDVLDSIVFCTV